MQNLRFILASALVKLTNLSGLICQKIYDLPPA